MLAGKAPERSGINPEPLDTRSLFKNGGFCNLLLHFGVALLNRTMNDSVSGSIWQNMRVCLHVYIHIYIHIYTHVYTHTYTCMYMHTRGYRFADVCLYVPGHEKAWGCKCMCMCVCVCVCVCVSMSYAYFRPSLISSSFIYVLSAVRLLSRMQS